MKVKTKNCEECESEYFANTSKMSHLCPECSHILYNYENCKHVFQDNRCIKCFWNGNITYYLKKIKREHTKIL